MTPGEVRPRERLAAVLAAVLSTAVLAFYLGLLRDQGDRPPAWVLALFAVGIAAAVAAAVRPRTRAALVGLVPLTALALVSLLSIGPLLLPSVALLALAHGCQHLRGDRSDARGPTVDLDR